VVNQKTISIEFCIVSQPKISQRKPNPFPAKQQERLKPSKAGLETSMDLITASGNIYTFYCVSADAPQPDLKVFVEPSDEKLLNAANGTPRLLPATEIDQFREAAALEVKAAQEQSNRFRNDYAVHGLKSEEFIPCWQKCVETVGAPLPHSHVLPFKA
jgi:hypothetical protein